jgi:hypothetical protein
VFNNNKLENDIQAEGCKVLNEILLENKNIENLNLNCIFQNLKKITILHQED